MATRIFFSHFTPLILTYFLLFFPSSTSSSSYSLNITALLSSYPDLSDFNNLLTTTSVAQDLAQRSSLTLLVVPNSFLNPDLNLTHHSNPSNIADVLRYHVLLQYLSWSELRQIPAAGELITTLYQTTGRATNNLGAVNVTRNPIDGSVSIRSPVAYSPLNVTLLAMIKTLPYNVSIFTVNSLLIPYGFDLMASDQNRPPPLGLNITRVLIDGHNFNVAASMLAASGVTDEFEKDEGGAGITVFIPTDDAFSDLPSEKFQSLSAEKKAVVLKFHVLHSYYPLGSLESIVNPVQPTLATEDTGAGRYTLNITRVNGSVAIDTGVVQASITQTVFDQNPVSIFAVSRVLLPRELFGKQQVKPINNEQVPNKAPPPETISSFSPENSPPAKELDNSSAHLSSPPGFRREAIRSNNGMRRTTTSIVISIAFALLCI